MAPATVRLVLVSHSRAIAQGVADLAAQMAPDVLVLPAGGTDDGGLGTAFDLITAAVERAVADGGSAVILTDLGSAVLTAESVLEMADPDVVARIRLVDAPFVEGAVQAAVVAQGGAELDDVARAAQDAALVFDAVSHGSGSSAEAAGAPGGGAAAPARPEGAGSGHEGEARGTAVLRNRLGLHARPAAQLVRTAGGFESTIAINGADARSVLSLVSLGAVGGQQLVVTAAGPDAAQAVRAVVAELEQGFGEA